MCVDAMRTLTLDDELAALLERDKPLEQAAREVLVMDLFRREKISTGKACELLGLDRKAFIRRANELDVPVYLTTEPELEADLATLEAWRQGKS
jgi:predicted HTH domain antitoxin